MKFFFIAFSLFFTCFISAQTRDTLMVWKDKVPNETKPKHPAQRTENTSGDVIRLTNVTNPILTVFKPKTPNGSKAGIIVCPGGGYNILAINKEGTEIAEWLNSLGYTAFVLEYRVPNNREGALQDAQRAIRLVRSKAIDYNLNPQKIGIVGFSAGGHLSVNATTNYQKDTYESIDAVDALSSRPNFTMLIYPAYLDKGENRSLSPEFNIDENTPPFFVFGTMDDPYGNSPLVISTALRDHKVPVELHMLPEGGHGYGLRKGNLAGETWPKLAENWLATMLMSSKLNDIQVIGSHNSYKIGIEPPLWKILNTMDSKVAKSLQYEHIPLEDQLILGLRNLELDVFHDPKGGHFSKPKGLGLVRLRFTSPLPYDEEKKLEEPGLKLFHVQDLDFRSHYLLFKEGLAAIKNWSDKNPNHLPVIILINAKDSKVKSTREPLPFTKEALNEIDNEIKSVLGDDKLITPDMVRGDSETLEAAILTKGWPNLDEVKGRFLFVLDEKEDKINRYVDGHPSLKNRVLFVNSKEGNPEAAFRIINNPISDFDYIKELVSKGYMIRTRADADTKEARANSYERFEKAKASGAQVISTDYYVPSTLFESQFKVIFEDGTYEKIKK
ncbi:Ca2+-dependent phosphoinositide-specific phospholipase C [Mariniflexile sp. AS56]|uniref:Ca2+-dependent phosphoinositide-specific phospholipase C n=1 Tax=Mariniflexile sp. AS56 TaxID=3063957 RepID=UPI0026EBF4AA|nr:Ca2+-dependent phosphoinositide-specific phospholipase C [Mariniflexile sp. AS56]MDO7171664.1 Ca2+-dependent phosphoinositide-specific phospholipase C [Mariniflexile sp. AS56]